MYGAVIDDEFFVNLDKLRSMLWVAGGCVLNELLSSLEGLSLSWIGLYLWEYHGGAVVDLGWKMITAAIVVVCGLHTVWSTTA